MRPSYHYPAKPVDNPDHISVLIPTRDRPEGIRRVLENFRETVENKALFDVWIYVDDDDAATLDFIAGGEWENHGFPVHWHVAQSTTSMGDMFNKLWQISTANAGIYFPFVDDYRVETPAWDAILREAFGRYPDNIMLGYPPDPTAQAFQVTLPIPSAGWLNALGYFITSRFYYWFEDMWVDEIAQIAERKVMIPIAVSTPEGKGKTPRMRNLPFWCFYFAHTLEDRYRDACTVLRAIHRDDEAALAGALDKAKRHAAVLAHKSAGYDAEALRKDEERFGDPGRKPRNSQRVNYLQAELLAIGDLLERLKSAADRDDGADLAELAGALELATFRVPDLDHLRLAPNGSGSGVPPHSRLPSWIDIEDRDFIHFPEEADQEIFYTIQLIMYKDPTIRTVLDIGAGRGDGTTRAVMEAAHFGASKHVFCIEPDKEKFAALKRSYGGAATLLNCSSVPVGEYQSESELAVFYKYLPGILNHYPLETVTGWRNRETEYLEANDLSRDGIDRIRKDHGISEFDLVVMDGSLFCGEADLDRVHGARYLVLNHVNSIKNYSNFRKLTAEGRYQLIAINQASRCGYAVLARR